MKMSTNLRTLAPTAGVVGAILFAAGLLVGVVIGRTAAERVDSSGTWDYTGCVGTNQSYEVKMGNAVVYHTYGLDDHVGRTTAQVYEVVTLTCRFPKLTADVLKVR